MPAAIPDSDGWWIFDEDGMHSQQRILVVGGIVASDDEWEEAVGYPPSEVVAENYWEGCSVAQLTDGTLTSGTWTKE